MSLIGGHLLPARVTHLEMTSPPLGEIAPAEITWSVGVQAHIAQVENCPVRFYLISLYRIGRHHHWGGSG